MSSKITLAVESGGIKVEIKGRNNEGKFTEASELHLKAGECAALSIPDGVSVQIFETKTTDNQ